MAGGCGDWNDGSGGLGAEEATAAAGGTAALEAAVLP